MQWIGAAFVDANRLRALLAAQAGEFAHVQVYRPEGGAIVMVGSDAPLDVTATAALKQTASASFNAEPREVRTEPSWVFSKDATRFLESFAVR